jgi:integrase
MNRCRRGGLHGTQHIGHALNLSRPRRPTAVLKQGSAKLCRRHKSNDDKPRRAENNATACKVGPRCEHGVDLSINRTFHSLCARAEVPQLRVHDLRHSCATLLFTMGVPPATVQRILRHSSITVTTGTYVDVIEAVQRDALGAVFEQRPGRKRLF